MKILFKLLVILTVFGWFNYSTVFAAEYSPLKVIVVPVDVVNEKYNYYAFPEVSEIVAGDVIDYFNTKTTTLSSPDVYSLREELYANPNLNVIVKAALAKYKTSNNLDYSAYKKISDLYGANSVLLVSSYVISKENSTKRGLWEILELATAFDIAHPFVLETNVVLIDTANDLVMLNRTYRKKIGDSVNGFWAQNYIQANAQLENIRMYSNDLISKDIAQNVILRYFPKTVRPVDKFDKNDKNFTPDGSIFRYDKLIPNRRIERSKPTDEFELGEMIYGF